MSLSIVRVIGVYEKQGNSFLKEIPLKGVSLETLQQLFGCDKDNPMYDCYPIQPEHVPFFEKYIAEKLDINSYDYFLECYGE